MNVQWKIAFVCSAIVSASPASTLADSSNNAASTNAGASASPKQIWVHVDFQDSKKYREVSGVAAILPRGGDAVHGGAGAVLPCGEKTAIPYDTAVDHVAILSKSPCDDASNGNWLKILAQFPYVFLPKPIHPNSRTIDPNELRASDLDILVLSSKPTEKFQVFEAGTDRALSIKELRQRIKGRPSMTVLQAKP